MGVTVADNSGKHVNAAIVGRRVLAGLNKGRRIGIEVRQTRSRERASLIFTLAAADIAGGKSMRGRSGRIARKMGGLLSESQVRRLLRAFSYMQNSIRHTPDIVQPTGGAHEPTLKPRT